MGSPQRRFCLPISDSGTGERSGDTASRLVIVTLGTDSRSRHHSVRTSRSPRRRRLVDRVSSPSSEASGRRFHAPCGPVSDGLRTASEDDNRGTIPGIERAPQVSGPEARLRLLDHPHANRRSPGRYAKWLGGSTETQRRRPTTLAAWGS